MMGDKVTKNICVLDSNRASLSRTSKVFPRPFLFVVYCEHNNHESGIFLRELLAVS